MRKWIIVCVLLAATDAGGASDGRLRGRLQVAITLAPTMPPAVQFMSVRPAPASGDGVHVLLTGR